MSAPSDRDVSAIVLAGGRSRRFGADKLGVLLTDGRSVLDHSVDLASTVASRVVLVIAPGARSPVGLSAPVSIVRDSEAYGGPLVGLLAGLEASTTQVVIVMGGDMPAAEPAVLGLLADALRGDPSADTARLEPGPEVATRVRVGHPGLAGGLVPLPCAVRRGPAIDAARAALAAGDRRLRGCLERLSTAVVPIDAWRSLDPAGRTLLDIDEPPNLAELAGPG